MITAWWNYTSHFLSIERLPLHKSSGIEHEEKVRSQILICFPAHPCPKPSLGRCSSSSQMLERWNDGNKHIYLKLCKEVAYLLRRWCKNIFCRTVPTYCTREEIAHAQYCLQNPLVNFSQLDMGQAPSPCGSYLSHHKEPDVTLRSHNQIEELKVECNEEERYRMLFFLGGGSCAELWDSTQVHIENVLPLPAWNSECSSRRRLPAGAECTGQKVGSAAGKSLPPTLCFDCTQFILVECSAAAGRRHCGKNRK